MVYNYMQNKLWIYVIIISFVVSILTSAIFSKVTISDYWEDVAIKKAVEIEKYKNAENQNRQIVNQMINDLKALKSQKVDSLLNKYGAK